MDTLIVWAIIALFYAPLHYLLPLLLVFFRYSDNEALRNQRLKTTAIDCTLSMVVSFTLVIFLAQEQLMTAMFILLGSMSLPYLRLLLRTQQN
jgi:hypothetical protein